MTKKKMLILGFAAIGFLVPDAFALGQFVWKAPTVKDTALKQDTRHQKHTATRRFINESGATSALDEATCVEFGGANEDTYKRFELPTIGTDERKAYNALVERGIVVERALDGIEGNITDYMQYVIATFGEKWPPDDNDDNVDATVNLIKKLSLSQLQGTIMAAAKTFDRARKMDKAQQVSLFCDVMSPVNAVLSMMVNYQTRVNNMIQQLKSNNIEDNIDDANAAAGSLKSNLTLLVADLRKLVTERQITDVNDQRRTTAIINGTLDNLENLWLNIIAYIISAGGLENLSDALIKGYMEFASTTRVTTGDLGSDVDFIASIKAHFGIQEESEGLNNIQNILAYNRFVNKYNDIKANDGIFNNLPVLARLDGGDTGDDDNNDNDDGNDDNNDYNEDDDNNNDGNDDNNDEGGDGFSEERLSKLMAESGLTQ